MSELMKKEAVNLEEPGRVYGRKGREKRYSNISKTMGIKQYKEFEETNCAPKQALAPYTAFVRHVVAVMRK